MWPEVVGSTSGSCLSTLSGHGLRVPVEVESVVFDPQILTSPAVIGAAGEDLYFVEIAVGKELYFVEIFIRNPTSTLLDLGFRV